MRGNALLIVNVASKCGFTPQYAGLENLHQQFSPRGSSVIGVPCNQFKEQEPGTTAEIAEFCSATHGVTFPMLAKTEVNGARRAPPFAEPTAMADDRGEAGDVQWNLGKFLVDAAREPVARFRSAVAPEDPALVTAIGALLPHWAPRRISTTIPETRG